MNAETWKFIYRPLALALMIAVAVSVVWSLQIAQAATIVISDESSCRNAGGVWVNLPDQCILRDFTVSASDTLETSVLVGFRGILTNHGTINLGQFADISSIDNRGTINVGRSATVASAFDNSGMINITNGRLGLSGVGSNSNSGTIDIK